VAYRAIAAFDLKKILTAESAEVAEFTFIAVQERGFVFSAVSALSLRTLRLKALPRANRQEPKVALPRAKMNPYL